MKCYKDPAGKVRPADEGDYSFAKYNKKARPLPAALRQCQLELIMPIMPGCMHFQHVVSQASRLACAASGHSLQIALTQV